MYLGSSSLGSPSAHQPYQDTNSKLRGRQTSLAHQSDVRDNDSVLKLCRRRDFKGISSKYELSLCTAKNTAKGQGISTFSMARIVIAESLEEVPWNASTWIQSCYSNNPRISVLVRDSDKRVSKALMIHSIVSPHWVHSVLEMPKKISEIMSDSDKCSVKELVENVTCHLTAMQSPTIFIFFPSTGIISHSQHLHLPCHRLHLPSWFQPHKPSWMGKFFF